MVSAQRLSVDAVEAEARVDDGSRVQNNRVANLGVRVLIFRDRWSIVQGSLAEGTGRGNRTLEQAGAAVEGVRSALVVHAVVEAMAADLGNSGRLIVVGIEN